MRLIVYFGFVIVLISTYSCRSEKIINEVGLFQEKNGVLENENGFETIHGVFPQVGIHKSNKDSITLYMTHGLNDFGDNDFEFSSIFSLKKKGRKYEIAEKLIGQEINDTCYFKINSDVKFFALKEFSYKLFKVK